MATMEYKNHINSGLIVCLCPGSDYWYVCVKITTGLGVLIFSSESCFGLIISVVSHFVTFPVASKYGHIGVKIPYKWWTLRMPLSRWWLVCVKTTAGLGMLISTSGSLSALFTSVVSYSFTLEAKYGQFGVKIPYK